MSKFNQARQFYRSFAKNFSRTILMTQSNRRSFGREVLGSHFKHLLKRVLPIKGECRKAADASVEWLIRAQSATPDAGVSYGYFPCDAEMGWLSSYPETTGYIIPSLIDYARRYDKPNVRKHAIEMAYWETGVQMDCGAVQGGAISISNKQEAAIFNTGMVLQGWTSAWRETGEAKFFESGRRAAEYLVADMDENGNFRTHGPFVSQHQIKTYSVLCAWALYRFGEDSGENLYCNAAIRNGEATLKEQNHNGWFNNCCLNRPDAPLTHTLGYALQGLLELGVLSGREDLITSVERGVSPIIQNISPKGFLAGRFDAKWKPRVRYSCLTGSAQIAIVLYRLSDLTGNKHYFDAANRLVDYLKALQRHDSRDINLNGAIPGSFPLFGSYQTAGYPNWATKFFLDAVMLQEESG